jgi:hypothetical protein
VGEKPASNRDALSPHPPPQFSFIYGFDRREIQMKNNKGKPDCQAQNFLTRI